MSLRIMSWAPWKIHSWQKMKEKRNLHFSAPEDLVLWANWRLLFLVCLLPSFVLPTHIQELINTLCSHKFWSMAPYKQISWESRLKILVSSERYPDVCRPYEYVNIREISISNRPRSPEGLCGSVVEHRSAESEGLRFDSSWGLRIFLFLQTLVTRRKTSFSISLPSSILTISLNVFTNMISFITHLITSWVVLEISRL